VRAELKDGDLARTISIPSHFPRSVARKRGSYQADVSCVERHRPDSENLGNVDIHLQVLLVIRWGVLVSMCCVLVVNYQERACGPTEWTLRSIRGDIILYHL